MTSLVDQGLIVGEPRISREREDSWVLDGSYRIKIPTQLSVNDNPLAKKANWTIVVFETPFRPFNVLFPPKGDRIWRKGIFKHAATISGGITKIANLLETLLRICQEQNAFVGYEPLTDGDPSRGGGVTRDGVGPVASQLLGNPVVIPSSSPPASREATPTNWPEERVIPETPTRDLSSRSVSPSPAGHSDQNLFKSLNTQAPIKKKARKQKPRTAYCRGENAIPPSVREKYVIASNRILETHYEPRWGGRDLYNALKKDKNFMESFDKTGGDFDWQRLKSRMNRRIDRHRRGIIPAKA